MNQGVQIRSSFILLACCAMALLGAAGPAHAASDSQYHTILDFTQGNSLNALITNTQATTSSRKYPYVGSDVNPYAIINPTYFPTGATIPTPDLYVRVLMNNTDVLSSSLTTATLNTCDQSDPTKCPSSGVPTTYVHRLGTYSSSSGIVTPLLNNQLSKVTMPNGTTAKAEVLNNMFTKNGQAFDMDRLRFAANRLWYEWYKEKTGAAQPGNWAARFSYQPTGTMSFENFVSNIVNNHPMFGIVRVMVPVNTKSEYCYNSSRRRWQYVTGDMLMDKNQPVDGNEFSTSHTWNGTGTCSSSPHLNDYEAMINTALSGTADSGTMDVYGMVLVDYIDKRTYNPNNFFDDDQDYIDNYATVADHDSASLTGRENVILPRSKGRNIVLMDWDNLRINPVDDLQSFVMYSDTHNAGADGRVDTLDIIRRKYMMNGVVPSTSSTTAAEVSDATVFNYWMRNALTYKVGNSTRSAIMTALLGTTSGNTVTTAGDYDLANQTFTGGTLRSDYNSNVWDTLAEQDRAHAYFPSGYERGWMIAMDALRLDELDKTTVSQSVGSWWSNLTQNVIDTNGNMTTKNYNPFELPDPNLFITVDADGDGYATKMPDPFETKWEDLPALAFAGGLLDVHGNANISGMLYTPDSCEIEAHAGSEVNGDTNSGGPFQYVNGALLVGNGLWLEDQRNADHSMIAIAYNYNSFNRLRSGVARLTITKVSNIEEIKGQ